MGKINNYLLVKNRAKLKYKRDFEKVFGLEFNRFYCKVMGFDICLLDEVLGTPDGKSLEGFVAEKYGEEGRLLIKNLIV